MFQATHGVNPNPTEAQQQMIRLVQPQIQGLQEVHMQGFQIAGIQGALGAQPQQQIITTPGELLSLLKIKIDSEPIFFWVLKVTTTDNDYEV